MPKPLRPIPPPSLFDPPPVRPTWEALPEAVRQDVVAILVRMIRDRSPEPTGGDAGREVGDE